ncbi:MAG: hypothetical protein HAW58_06120 [Candidatus Thioglobus sp.]|nr:hypothetical protein [Candidatus Thioglobus sp.]
MRTFHIGGAASASTAVSRSLSHKNYRFLMNLSLRNPEFFKYTVDLYNKYNKFHGYNCTIENNIASFFIGQKQFSEAQKHVDIIQNSNNSSCLKPAILSILNQQNKQIYAQ